MQTKFIIPILLLCLSGGSCKKENNGNPQNGGALYTFGEWNFYKGDFPDRTYSDYPYRFIVHKTEVDTTAHTLTAFALDNNRTLNNKVVIRFSDLPERDTVYAFNDTSGIQAEVMAAIYTVRNDSLLKYRLYTLDSLWRVRIDPDRTISIRNNNCMAVSSDNQDTFRFFVGIVHYFGDPEN